MSDTFCIDARTEAERERDRQIRAAAVINVGSTNSGLRPARMFSPGELLGDELEARGWDRNDPPAIPGYSAETLDDIINGKKQITRDISIALGQALGTSPDFWYNLERRYRAESATS